MKQKMNLILKIVIVILLCIILFLEYKIYTSQKLLSEVKYDGSYEIPDEVYEMIEKEKKQNKINENAILDE